METTTPSPSSSSPQNPDPDSQPKSSTTISTQKKPQPLPWTHQETTHLIQAYQEKWYSLKKGQLKSSQWEEVAITVAARCGYDDPSKTSTQCRHKMEKLRKRYRAEKQCFGTSSSSLSSWQFFNLMDRMDRGPLPISARPMTIIKCQNANDDDIDDDVDDDEEDDDVDEESDSRRNHKSRSINHILQRPSIVNRFAAEPRLNEGGKRRDFMQNRIELAEEEEKEEVGEMDGGKEMLMEMAVEIRRFAESFVRMENWKMEMMKETERYRMEMENRRTEMIVESQKKIMDTIGKALGSHKKMKITHQV